MTLSPLRALQGVFFMNAVGIAIWLPRLPDVKAGLDLDVFQLSLCLTGAPIGTFVGFLFAARLSRDFGPKRICLFAGAGMCFVLILPAAAFSALSLFLALFAVGLAIATIEVGINAKANTVQRTLGRRIMSRCHGMWSFGAMAAGLIAGGFAQAGVSPFFQQLIMEPLIAAAAFAFALALPDDPARSHVEDAGFRLPRGPLLILSLVPIAALLVEAAMLDWSVLFLRDDVGMSAFEASVVFSIFAMAMGFGRLGGDWATERLGLLRVIWISGCAMTIGMVCFGLSSGAALAVVGALFAGVGAANVYPLIVSIAPDVPGGSPEDNVAAIALSAFTAFLIGPPLIGFVAELSSLAVSFLVLAPIAFLPAAFVFSGLLAQGIGRAAEGEDIAPGS